MSKTFAGYLHFIWAGLAKHGQTGAILPSQRFLIEKMIAPIPETYTGEIIELGAGNGALTLRLAAKCPAARILACEINPALARASRRNLRAAGINGRVKVTSDSAEHLLSQQQRRRGTDKAEFIVSGIPLGNLGKRQSEALLDSIGSTLAPKGMYIQFQHFMADLVKVKARFPNLRLAPVLLNLPPAVVYYARK
jgi:phosphatidylethanolamine/phosphatidyl-N-methylethanolamine N-methyltransferase